MVSAASVVPASLEKARAAWVEIYSKTLPAAAKSRSAAQKTWPVSLDHCFARIILDNVVGKTAPWPEVIKSPAYKHMTEGQLTAATTMGSDILYGKEDLVALNLRSLELRKKKGPKRNHAALEQEANGVKKVKTMSMGDVGDKETGEIADNMIKQQGESPAVEKRTIEAESDEEEEAGAEAKSESLFDIGVLDRSTELTPFRRKVLRLLYTVPRGRWTTYGAMSDALSSSPRAVGNAMRNNPYAPMIPCHRVLASDGSIGGFGGDWGTEGRHYDEKVKLLRSEGVKFDGKGKVVGRAYDFK